MQRLQPQFFPGRPSVRGLPISYLPMKREKKYRNRYVILVIYVCYRSFFQSLLTRIIAYPTFQCPGQGVAAVAKGLGVLWSQLTDDEKKVYQDKAQLEKERLVEELQAWKDAGGELVEEELLPALSSSGNGGLIFPVARIRKICKLDPDVKNLSKEALMLVTKAAEVFTSKIGTEAMRVASVQNRRKLQAGDIAQVCASREQFLFLREDLADLSRLKQKEAQEKTAVAKTNQAATNKPPPFSGKPLTSYFGVKK
jgi:histone H3/H4